jgi:membrane protein DedA with SNARE-associated domain
MAIEYLPLVARYGYAATFIGTLLEGETVLVLSGVAAARGLLTLPVLVVVGALAAFITDNFFFALGRLLGPALFARFPQFASSASRVSVLVGRLPNTSVIGLRFFYGMRSVGPAIIGSGGMSWARFALLDVLAAVLWSGCWTSAGFVLGGAAEALVERFGRYAYVPLLGLGVAAGVALVVFRVRRRRTRDVARGPDRTGGH